MPRIDGQERAKSRQQKEIQALGYQAKKKIRLKPTSLEISINCYLDKTRTIAKIMKQLLKIFREKSK